jgi:hypothetical protein
MKRVFATAASLLSMLTIAGAGFAAFPAAAGNPAVPAAPAVFSAPVNVSQSGGAGAKGSWIGAATDGTVDIAYAGSDNTSTTIAQNQVFAGPFAQNNIDGSSSWVGNMKVKHDNLGRVHAAWYHNQGSNTVIYYGVRDPGQANWRVAAIPGTVTGPGTNGGYKVVDLAVTPDGKVWVVFSRNGIGAKIVHSDDTVNWSAVEDVPGPFSSTAADFAIGVTTNQTIIVGWFDRGTTDIMTRMRPLGGAWGDITDISARANRAQGYTPHFAASPDGGLRVIWNEVDPNNTVCEGRGCRDVWYREWSPVSGWSPNMVQLFSTPGETNDYGIAVDSTGEAYITFDDDSHRPSKDVTTYYIHGRGTTFSAPEAVYPSSWGLAVARHPDIDVNGGFAHIAANSNVTGSYENYYAYTQAAGGSITPLPTATNTPHACVPGQFDDVPAANPFYRYITDLVTRGAISGYSDCTFRWENNITRGQTAKVIMLASSDKYQIINPPVESFEDVPYGSTFYTYIETAYRNGIISGYTCGGVGEPCDGQNRPYFRPNNQVTRGQLSKMASLARQWTLLNPSTPTFTDVPQANPFYKEVETAYAHGIISGYTCGAPPAGVCDPQNRPYFIPFGTATRGQASKIIDLSLYSNDITPTPVPPTATATSVPPTATSVPPTATVTGTPPTATQTSVPPTATSTAVPPTATHTSVPATVTTTATPMLNVR